jgi:hypothetical protein
LLLLSFLSFIFCLNILRNKDLHKIRVFVRTPVRTCEDFINWPLKY